jgi:hypothetical protein
MGGAVSATKDKLKDEQKIDLFDELVDTARKVKSDFRPPANTNEEKLQYFNDLAPTFETFAKSVGFSDSLMKSMDENYKRRSQKLMDENTQVKKVSAFQMFREKNGKLEKVVMEGMGRKAGAREWRYKPGDERRDQVPRRRDDLHRPETSWVRCLRGGSYCVRRDAETRVCHEGENEDVGGEVRVRG